MARVTCPECFARLGLPDGAAAGKRLRCPECGAAFRPTAGESDRPGRGGATETRLRKRRKKGLSGARIVVLAVGGGVAALLAAGLIVLGVVLLLPRSGPVGLLPGPGSGGLFGASQVTVENFHKLARGMSVKEAEAILGPGTKCTMNDFFQANDPTGEIAPALKALPQVQNDPTTWRRWQNGGLDIFVNFRTGKSGVERAGAFYLINRLPGGEIDTETQEDNPLEDLDAMAAQRSKDDQLVNNPRWKTGPAIRAALVGKWRLAGTAANDRTGWDFGANGSCVHYGAFGGDSVAPGTYHFTDDAHIATSVAAPDFFPGKPPTQVTEKFKVLVDDKELILVYDNPNGPSPNLALSRQP